MWKHYTNYCEMYLSFPSSANKLYVTVCKDDTAMQYKMRN